MHRKQFLQQLLALPILSKLPTTHTMNNFVQQLHTSPTMPLLFLGHGNPMNAIEENDFVQGFRQVAQQIPTPQAVLCISAHWETKGTYVTAMAQPKTIHDFYGFPPALFEVNYPAPGHPALANEIANTVTAQHIQLDHDWGLDHGTWSVVKHLYPKANIPVLQLSLNVNQTPQQHYQFAQSLQWLRQRGVLIIGSGNMVHNLGLVAWNKLNQPFAFDWATEAQQIMNQCILQGQHTSLVHYAQQGKAFQLAIPTPEHFLPLLYILALQNKNEQVALFNNQPVGGSLSMTSVIVS